MFMSIISRGAGIGFLLLSMQAAHATNSYNLADISPQTPAAKAGILISHPAPVVNLLNNGGFETNSGSGTSVFANWTAVANTVPGRVSGWFVQTGITSPFNLTAVEMPTEGDFAAITESNGPGTNILYQDFQVPAGGAQLSCDIYINNRAADFFNNGSLSYSGNPNQHFRMDIMDTAAALDDVGTGVLQNLFITNPGDALVQSYQTISTDLSAFSGQTLRLRFAEVDNQFFFNVGVDNCVLQALGSTAPVQPVPVGGRWSWLFLTLAMLLFSGMLLWKRKPHC